MNTFETIKDKALEFLAIMQAEANARLGDDCYFETVFTIEKGRKYNPFVILATVKLVKCSINVAVVVSSITMVISINLQAGKRQRKASVVTSSRMPKMQQAVAVISVTCVKQRGESPFYIGVYMTTQTLNNVPMNPNTKKGLRTLITVAIIGAFALFVVKQDEKYAAEGIIYAEQAKQDKINEAIDEELAQRFALSDIARDTRRLQKANTGEIQESWAKNSFGDVTWKSLSVLPGDPKHQPSLGAEIDFLDNNSVSYVVNVPYRPFNIDYRRELDVQFDNVSYRFAFLSCKVGQLCVALDNKFGRLLKKSKTVRIALPYSDGLEITEYNVSQLAEVLNENY